MDTFSTLILCVLIVGLTSGSDIVNEYPSQKKKYETSEYPKELVRAPVPENTKPGDFSLPDDKCGDFSVRFKDDDYCYPLLERGPCSNPYFWVTVDPYTFKVTSVFEFWLLVKVFEMGLVLGSMYTSIVWS